jgi:hypothetical protein
MPRMRVDKLECEQCAHYEYHHIHPRCLIDSNIYKRYYGNCFRLTPSGKNYNGKCPDYKEKNNNGI